MNEDNECNNDSESIELERENHVYKQTWIVLKRERKKHG